MKKSIYYKVLICNIVLSLCGNVFSQDSDLPWDYPLKPGMSDWKFLKNSAEKIRECQIPDSILSSSSTDRLVELCIRYPLILDILAFNSILDGFGKYAKNFNGYQELLNRSDAGLVLINKYSSENALKIKTELHSFKEKFGFAIKLSLLELFLSHEQILNKLNHDQKVDLNTEFRLKMSQKLNSDPIYRDIGIQTVSLGIIQIIKNEDFPIAQDIDMDLIEAYITSGVIISDKVFEEIDRIVEDYITK